MLRLTRLDMKKAGVVREVSLIFKCTGPMKIMLAGLLGSNLLVSIALSQVSPGKEPGPTASPSIGRTDHEVAFYKRLWGIDNIQVRETSSGVLLRFSYRVVNAKKAQVLNDKKATPYLVEEKTGAMLQVPTMDMIGQLRQTVPPENGRFYWMVFSNKGEFIKPGSRVDIVIGSFRANGLVVE